MCICNHHVVYVSSRCVRIIIFPCPNWSIMPKSGVFSTIIESLVPLFPHGLIGPHVPVTRVWGTLIEVNYH